MKTIALLAVLLAAPAAPEIATQVVEYKHGDLVLEGYLAWPKDAAGKLPGVLVCHPWMGNDEYPRRRAEETARLGYVAFALDMYGKDNLAKDTADAAKRAGGFKADRPALRARALAGYEVLRKNEHVDPKKIAVMGYCFGGTTALEIARSGAELAGAISFHGGLSTPTPDDAKQIKGRILALHGADDPYVPPAEVAAFEDEMRKAGVDWQLVAFGGAVHSFTMKSAGSDNSKGAAYQEKADRRSWEMYRDFLAELFQ